VTDGDTRLVGSTLRGQTSPSAKGKIAQLAKPPLEDEAPGAGAVPGAVSFAPRLPTLPAGHDMTQSCSLAAPPRHLCFFVFGEAILTRDQVHRAVEGLHECCDTPGTLAAPLRPRARGSLQSAGQFARATILSKTSITGDEKLSASIS
jgi:hypothetical protein